MPGAGPVKVITDRGVLVASEEDGEMELAALYPRVAPEDVTSRVGWALRVRARLESIAPPTAEELRLLRDVLDPDKLYLKGERDQGLTPRELEILQLIVEGKSNKEIASQLNLSANTIAVHRANIMDALGIHKTAELVVYAIRNGLVNIT